MRKLTILMLCSFAALNLYATPLISTPTIESYISKYRLIAQLESHRSGIPASIILAQAILESGYGNSDLCKKSNNHFGIKWKGTNDGDFVYSMDDDYDKNGRHIPSKFIKYDDDAESFRHHSDFIMNRSHYSSLFKYQSYDFENWAYGLRACGYSTDSRYGVQLVQLIHRYNLNFYDFSERLKKPTRIKSIEDTKTLIKILEGKAYMWDILLKKQSTILEQSSIAIANAPQIKTSISKCLSKPIVPNNSSKNNTDNWAWVRTLFTNREDS